MRRFNKDKYLHKLQNRNNKKTKIISIVISVVVLIGAMIFFSFARFESKQTFSLINGIANKNLKAVLTDGESFNYAIRGLVGDTGRIVYDDCTGVKSIL